MIDVSFCSLLFIVEVKQIIVCLFLGDEEAVSIGVTTHEIPGKN
jgi:hypothetical protein